MITFSLLAPLICLVVVLLSAPHAACDHDINDYGAIPNNATSFAAQVNGFALYKAVLAAAAGANGSRTALIP
jgi:hypothetical protein